MQECIKAGKQVSCILRLLLKVVYIQIWLVKKESVF